MIPMRSFWNCVPALSRAGGRIRVRRRQAWQTGAMLLGELVRTTDAVASTRSRLAKVEALAGLLRRLDAGRDRTGRRPPHREAAAGPGRGRLARHDGGHEASRPPSRRLTVADLDAALDRLLGTAGAGSAAERAAAAPVAHCRAATEREQAFIAGVLLGELRTGALEGVLLDAIARGAGAARRRRAPRRDALRRPRRDRRCSPSRARPAELDAVGLVVGRPVHADARRRPRQFVARRSRSIGARHPSNTSSTARASRCTAPATTCASSPATSPTSPTGCPRSSRWCAACRCSDVILDGETLPSMRTAARGRSRTRWRGSGPDAARTTRAASVVLRRPAPRRPRPHRRAAVDAHRRARTYRRRGTGSRERSRPIRPWLKSSRAMRSPRGTRAWWSRRSTRPTRPAGAVKSWVKVKPVLTYDLVVLAVRVGLRAAHGAAVEPAPRRPRPRRGVRRTRRLRDGGQDLQGPHRRSCCGGRPRLPAIETRRTRGRRARAARAPSSRSRSTACSAPRAIPAASPCGSHASSATATTRRPQRPTPSRHCARCCVRSGCVPLVPVPRRAYRGA